MLIAFKIVRVRLQELRTFLRFPRRLRIGRKGRRIVLYGVPFADWNATLADPATWAGIEGVAEVWRVPALRWLVGWRLRETDIVIPMKGDHAVGRPDRGLALVPKREIVAVLQDKGRFAGFMAGAGLGDLVPAAYADVGHARFPCILKRTGLSASIGVAVARSPDGLAALLEARPFRGRSWLLQELVPGAVEYTTHLVCRRGRIEWHRSFAFTMAGPELVRSEDNALRRDDWTAPAGVLAALERALTALSYDGPCNIDFKLDPAGALKIFEINPRLGGTLLLASAAADLRRVLACIVALAQAT